VSDHFPVAAHLADALFAKVRSLRTPLGLVVFSFLRVYEAAAELNGVASKGRVAAQRLTFGSEGWFLRQSCSGGEESARKKY